MKIEQKEFGRTKAGEVASLYTLTNGHGSQVQISDYGATIVSIFVPDRTGKLANVNAASLIWTDTFSVIPTLARRSAVSPIAFVMDDSRSTASSSD